VNNLIGSKDLLAQLDTLKSVVQDFAAREEKLNTTFREQSGRETNAFDTRDNQLATNISERLAAQADGLTDAKAALQNRVARRKARINRVHNFISARIQTSINTQEEECKSKAQQGLIEAEHRRNTDLAQAVANFDAFRQRQAQIAQSFQQLDQSVRNAFSGCGKFRRPLNNPAAVPETGPAGDGNLALDEVERLNAKIQADLARFKKYPLPQVFRFVPVWLLAAVFIAVAVADPVLAHLGHPIITHLHAVIALVALALVLAVHIFGLGPAAPLAAIIAADFLRAHWLLDASWDQAAAFHQSEQQRIETEFQETKDSVNQEWKQMSRGIVQLRNRRPTEVEDRVARLHQQNEQFYQAELQRMQEAHNQVTAQMRQEDAQQSRRLADIHKAVLDRLENEHQNAWQKLEAEWRERTLPLCESLQSAKEAAEKHFPDWPAACGDDWKAPDKFLNAAIFARLEVELDKFIGTLPQDKRLVLPGAKSLYLPLLLTQPQQGSLLFETGKDGGGEAVNAINNIILRLLATTPPGRLEFTIFDPVGLGQNFASLMHLADYESSTINSRIWTQSAQFEEKLADLNEHMEKIIQMYLRNEYATITEYNAEAGSVAEKYQFLVIASFPVNFSDTAARRLRNIAAWCTLRRIHTHSMGSTECGATGFCAR
jgi:DNA segregation ATPase FtsK/SpoIIIE, S-DNA-T family